MNILTSLRVLDSLVRDSLNLTVLWSLKLALRAFSGRCGLAGLGHQVRASELLAVRFARRSARRLGRSFHCCRFLNLSATQERSGTLRPFSFVHGDCTRVIESRPQFPTGWTLGAQVFRPLCGCLADSLFPAGARSTASARRFQLQVARSSKATREAGVTDLARTDSLLRILSPVLWICSLYICSGTQVIGAGDRIISKCGSGSADGLQNAATSGWRALPVVRVLVAGVRQTEPFSGRVT